MYIGKKRILIALICVVVILIESNVWAASMDIASQTDSPKPSRAGEMRWLNQLNIEFSGVVEVEAGYVGDSSETGESSYVTLATVEIGVDIAPVKHASAHVLFLFEEGDTDPIDVDEAYIRLDGEDKIPFYVSAGRQYLPFGNFESHFISDPLTLELGETRESSLIVGYADAMFEATLSIFNGDVDEVGEQDDHIDGYTAGVVFTPRVGKHFELTAGLSYISNIGDSDGLQGEDGIDADNGGQIDSYVDGVAAFVSARITEKIFLELEVVAALDDFVATQLGFDNGEALKPLAFNTELIYQVNDRLTAGVRLAGSDDGGSFLPETQYGAVVTYNLFEGVSLGLEYQYGEFDTPDNDDITTVIAQLGMEF